MVKLTIQFDSNDLYGRLVWNNGIVNVQSNRIKGIRATINTEKSFDNINDITKTVIQVIKAAKIQILEKRLLSDKSKAKVLVDF